VIPEVYQQVETHMKPGAYLGFCHGMAIHAHLIQPRADINVFLLAPKAQGRGVRSRYLEGKGVPGLVAVHQDVSGDTLDMALAYGKAIGCGWAGILATTFGEETISNHFSEQAVLCGGLSKLIQTAFEVQVEAGISPEVAYFGCLHEVKLLADLLYEGGITHMRQKISPTARYGDLTRGERIIDGHVKESMRQVLQDVTSDTFAREFLADVATGAHRMEEALLREAHHPIEQTGNALREKQIL
jgi:ketol-acid reductoisomerase